MLKTVKYFFITVITGVLAVSSFNAYQCRHVPSMQMPVIEGFNTYAGVIHIHTTYSDGSATYEEIADIADSMGLDFVIPTDHNTVQPLRDYPNGVQGKTLVIPSVEISTNNSQGHFIVIGDSIPLVPRNGITSGEVFIHSLEKGNLVYLAHVYHPRKKLDWDNWRLGNSIRYAESDTFHTVMHSNLNFLSHFYRFTKVRNWENWDIGNFNGFEFYNFDEHWRDNISLRYCNRIFGVLIMSRFRDDTFNYILTFPEKEMNMFDQLSLRRKVVGIGSLDAHSKLKITKKHFLRYPAYDDMFKLVQTYIVTRERFNGTYDHDKKLILHALRDGNTFVGFAGLQNPTGFHMTVSTEDTLVTMGESILLEDTVDLNIRIPSKNSIMIQLIKNGLIVEERRNENEIDVRLNDPGIYRVQVFQLRTMLPFGQKRMLPWILTNPIYVYKKSDNMQILSNINADE